VTTTRPLPAKVFEVELSCHPATPCAAVRRIQARVSTNAAILELRYRVEGDLQRLVIPGRRSAQRADKLWQHTCFEAFVRNAHASGYIELNFSPSGEWAAYRFSGYRIGMTDAATAAPRISVQSASAVLQMDVDVDLDALDPAREEQLQLALCAVIEDAADGLSYWALAHPAAKPDFHHAGGFVLEIGG
jgi:hypothetical protein